MFWPLFFAGVTALPSNTTTKLKFSGEHVSLHLPSLKEHIRVFIITFRPKLKSCVVLKLQPPLLTGAKTYQVSAVPPHRTP
jgi:hypothetical protein